MTWVCRDFKNLFLTYNNLKLSIDPLKIPAESHVYQSIAFLKLNVFALIPKIVNK